MIVVILAVVTVVALAVFFVVSSRSTVNQEAFSWPRRRWGRWRDDWSRVWGGRPYFGFPYKYSSMYTGWPYNLYGTDVPRCVEVDVDTKCTYRDREVKQDGHKYCCQINQ